MDEDKKAYPEKYHYISGSKLSGFINEPCYWVSEGNSFRDIEKSVLQFYSFKKEKGLIMSPLLFLNYF